MTTPEPTADAYRLSQNRITLASTRGQHALRDIMLATTNHRETGSMAIEKRVKGRWRMFGVIWNE